jgi:hypothetical protein
VVRMDAFKIAARYVAVFLALAELTACAGGGKIREAAGESALPQTQLTGRVVNETQLVGVSGIKVNLLLQDRIAQSNVTDENGVFTFGDIPEGALKIEVFDLGSEWEAPGPTAVRNDFSERAYFTMEDILVGEPSTRFTGRVVYRKGEVEVPIERAVVALIGTADNTRTNGNGDFELRSRNMLEGISSYVITVFAGQDFKPEVVRLPPGFRIQERNLIGTVVLLPLAGKTDPNTRISPGYAPPWRGSGGSTID